VRFRALLDVPQMKRRGVAADTPFAARSALLTAQLKK
jgi:hypothetical protein